MSASVTGTYVTSYILSHVWLFRESKLQKGEPSLREEDVMPVAVMIK